MVSTALAHLRAVCIALICLVMSGSVVFAAAPPNDPHFNARGSWGQDFDDQWALKQQRVYADIAPADAQEEIIVAIIDTGLDYKHEDLAAEKIWHNPGEQKNGRDDDGNGYVDDLIGWNFVDNNNNPWDLSGHGTHIAGLIAACTNNAIGIAGVNPQARIMPLKVANFIGQARSSSVAAAIYYAVDHGARIINLSLGGELVTDLERQAAAYAQARDVLLLVAAGNKGISDKNQGYAGLPGVLVVGASDLNGQRAGFSNFGANVGLVAPGVDILSLRASQTDFIALTDPLDYPEESAVVGEDRHYYRASGTSFATALASGVASRVLSQKPRLTSSELQELLKQSAADVAPEGVDQLTGYGQLDYIAALTGNEDEFVRARLISANLELDAAVLFVALQGTAMAGNFAGASLELRAAPDSIPTPAEVDSSSSKKDRNKKDKKKKDKKKKEKKKKDKKKQDKKGDKETSPYDWQPLAELNAPVDADVLGRFGVLDLTRMAGGSTQWEIRLLVKDMAGHVRSSSMSLSLPQPEITDFQDAEN